jgi:hypothetical protein
MCSQCSREGLRPVKLGWTECDGPSCETAIPIEYDYCSQKCKDERIASIDESVAIFEKIYLRAVNGRPYKT